ncbi:MAG TPA: alpha-amylase family glycosyl hydrolase [Capsulimonadaceae bacterium]|nr:alpha-amylase family glycosyl hydrolase [Capsulimonadaceae bacterium]
MLAMLIFPISRPLFGLFVLIILLVFSRPSFAQGIIFQDFYWDVNVPSGHADWWTYTTQQLQYLARAGVSAVWVPDPVKGGAGKFDMGYGPYDLYDLGSKDQKGTIPTRFGTKEEFLRFVAVAHANGIRVYTDTVLNQANGADYAEPNPLMAKLGMDDIPDDSKVPAAYRPPDYAPDSNLRSWTGFVPKGADGQPGTGRFPRHWDDFHPSPSEPDRDPPYHVQEFGPDYSFNANNSYVEKNMIAWSRWLVAQSDVDGYRIDDLKGLDPYFATAFTSAAAQNKKNFFMVGEYLDGDAVKLDMYLASAGGEMTAYDYPLYFALHDMTFQPEQFSMTDLLKRRMPNRAQAITFVNNHDMSRGDPISTNFDLAQAVVLAMSGTPCVYYSDYWRRGDRERAVLDKLVWAHNYLAVGQEVVREVNKTTLVLERSGHLLAGFNSGGDGLSHRVTVRTAFGPHVRLKDYAPGSTAAMITTGADGNATLTITPFGYVLYGRVSAASEHTKPRPPLPTTQTTEFADDLDTGEISNTPRDVPITAAEGTALSATLTGDSPAKLSLQLIASNGKVISTKQGSRSVRISRVALPTTGRYLLRCLAASGKAHGFLTVTYWLLASFPSTTDS